MNKILQCPQEDPDTLAVLNAVTDGLKTVEFQFTEGASTNYALTKRTLNRCVPGGLKDYKDNTPLAVALLHTGHAERHNFGGRNWHQPGVKIRYCVDMTDGIAAEINIAKIYDAFSEFWLKHAKLLGATGVFHSRLNPDSILFGYAYVQRIEYRALEMALDVWQESVSLDGYSE